MKTVLFDFDGTVADTLPIIFSAFRSTFHTFLNSAYPDEQIVGLFGPTETGILHKLIPAVNLHEAVEHFFHAYEREHSLPVENDPVREMLTHFKQAGIRMGVVTGKGRRSADISLRALELAEYFDVMITGDDVVHPKPHPEGIFMAMPNGGIPLRPDSSCRILRTFCIALYQSGHMLSHIYPSFWESGSDNRVAK